MAILFVVGVAVVYAAEQHGTPAQHLAGVSTDHLSGSTGGNLEGKEQRFGIADSTLWTAVTTATSSGAVNAAFESLTGLGGAVPFANLSMGEVVFGGAGTGLYSMLVFVLLAVFIGGLMVGRTPEYLGKKIEAREIKLVVLGLLFTPLTVLLAARPSTSARSLARARSSCSRSARCSRRSPRWARARPRSQARPDTSRSRRPGRRGSRRTSTPTSRRPTTTGRRGPATPATSSHSPATSAPTASHSRTCSAAR
jgi:hypothetical protein